MKELLTKKNLEYAERTKEIADKYVRPAAAELDRNQTYPWEIVKKLQEAGLMGVWIPKEYGGEGDGIRNLCIVIEELSKACGGVGVAYAVNALGSFPITIHGTEEQRQRWLPAIAKGEKLVAYGLSEVEAGSDAGSIKTRAERNGDSYTINGDKKWTTNAGAASIYTIYCVTNPEKGTRGISAIVVEKGTEGFTIGKEEDKMGIRCVSLHEIHFKNCKVPAKNLLGEKEGIGFKNAMMTLDKARPGVAAQAVGLAQGALDLAVEYTKKRQQFGQPIASFQGIQFMLADMATQVEAARRLVYAAADAIDAGATHYTKISAMCKLYATDVAMKVTTDAVQLFGGYGYMKDYPIEKYMRDAKITQIYEGTNQIQRIVIAKNLLKESGSS
ncbi:acyl-CoA dehydrogenase family protein [candidate division TA06 bacterium]|nr:acyl-CoA dehydrogenase family protein [candidate division TA06 bacterium]